MKNFLVVASIIALTIAHLIVSAFPVVAQDSGSAARAKAKAEAEAQSRRTVDTNRQRVDRPTQPNPPQSTPNAEAWQQRAMRGYM